MTCQNASDVDHARTRPFGAGPGTRPPVLAAMVAIVGVPNPVWSPNSRWARTRTRWNALGPEPKSASSSKRLCSRWPITSRSRRSTATTPRGRRRAAGPHPAGPARALRRAARRSVRARRGPRARGTRRCGSAARQGRRGVGPGSRTRGGTVLMIVAVGTGVASWSPWRTRRPPPAGAQLARSSGPDPRRLQPGPRLKCPSQCCHTARISTAQTACLGLAPLRGPGSTRALALCQERQTRHHPHERLHVDQISGSERAEPV